MGFLAIDTGNGKIVGKPRRGFAAALALPIRNTCPASCPMRDQGCYAQGGRVAMVNARLEREHAGESVLTVARAAAREIEGAAMMGLAKGRPLRLFTSGDARTATAARTIARAARTWLSYGGAAAWGYTHAWRDVPADSWRGVSMLASVESVADAARARAAGYAVARVVAEHPADGRAFDEGGIRWIPCPEQTRGVPCVACGLCFDAEGLRARNAGITFAAHGQRTEHVKRRLPMLAARASEGVAA